MGQVQSSWIHSQLRTSFPFELLPKLTTSTMTPTAPTICILIFCLSFTLSHQQTCEGPDQGPDRILGTFNQVYPSTDTSITVTKKPGYGYDLMRLDSNGVTSESWSLYHMGLDPLTVQKAQHWCFHYYAPGLESPLVNFISDMDKGVHDRKSSHSKSSLCILLHGLGG